MSLPLSLLVEADLFFSYLTADDLSKHSEKVILAAGEGRTRLYTCSEVYDEITSALRSDGVSIDDVLIFLGKMKAIPHQPLPVTIDAAEEALKLYKEHGGSRRLHYFDCFHVATAKRHTLPLVTSDGYILKHAREFGITVMNLATL